MSIRIVLVTTSIARSDLKYHNCDLNITAWSCHYQWKTTEKTTWKGPPNLSVDMLRIVGSVTPFYLQCNDLMSTGNMYIDYYTLTHIASEMSSTDIEKSNDISITFVEHIHSTFEWNPNHMRLSYHIHEHVIHSRCCYKYMFPYHMTRVELLPKEGSESRSDTPCAIWPGWVDLRTPIEGELWNEQFKWRLTNDTRDVLAKCGHDMVDHVTHESKVPYLKENSRIPTSYNPAQQDCNPETLVGSKD